MSRKKLTLIEPQFRDKKITYLLIFITSPGAADSFAKAAAVHKPIKIGNE